MRTVAIVLAVLIIIAGIAIVLLRSRVGARPVDGLRHHRRHMDALSSDARREVIDRVQRAQHRDGDDDDFDDPDPLAGGRG